MAAVITVQVGQCGNQVGMRVLDALVRDAGADERFFRRARAPRSGGADEPVLARAVLVDMEPKAVREASASAAGTGLWAYAPNRSFCEEGGSGNNWAHGFHEHGPRSRERVTELIRAELELADRAGGVLIYQALAGGTGSGVGAHIAASVRDEWPELAVASAAIWPSERGDVAVQPYNVALSLAALSESADAVLLLENDAVQSVCERVLKIARPSHDDLNRLIARHIAPLLAPSTAAAHGRAGAGGAHGDGGGRELSLLAEPLTHLCAHPAYKLLCTRLVPQTPLRSLGHTANRWPAVIRPLSQMVATDALTEDRIDWAGAPEEDVSQPRSRALAHWLVLRGAGASAVDVRMLSRERAYAQWAGSPAHALLVSASDRPLAPQDKTAALVSNSQLVLPPLRRLVSRACALFAERAYVHQYERYGMDVDELCMRIAQVEQIAHNYAEL